MAENNIIITVQLRDLATKKLQEIQNSIKKVESSTKKYAKLEQKSRNNAAKEADKITSESAKKKIKHEADILATKSALNTQFIREYTKQQKDGLATFEKLQKETRKRDASDLLAHLSQKEKHQQAEFKSRERFQRAADKEAARRLSEQAKAEQKKQKEAEKATSKQQKDQQKLSKSIQKAELDFTQFNKTLFTTAAFIGTFAKLSQSFWGGLQEGAQLDRLQNQFKRLFGSTGISKEITQFTTTAVDEVTAMQAAIEMGNLGVARNSTDAAKIIAMAATASKNSNLDTAYGINEVVSALKTGSLANLEHLNLIKTGDPALKQRLALLQKFSGIMSPAVVAQEKYNIILSALERKTKDLMFAERDLLDVLTDVKSSFKVLAGTLGSFLGRAVGGIVFKFKQLTDKVTEFFERAKKNKPLLELTKNLVVLGATAAGMIASLGTLRLAFKLAGGIGLGSFGGIVAVLVGIATSLKDLKDPISQLGSMLKTVGAMAGGIFQLVSSFFLGEGNLQKGVGQINEELALFLQSIKIGQTDALELVLDISRAAIVTIKFIQDVIEKVKEVFNSIVNSAFFKNNIYDITKNQAGAWSRVWLDEATSVRDFMVNAAAAITTAWAASKLLPSGMLSKTGKAAGTSALKYAPGAAGAYAASTALGTDANAYNVVGSALGTVGGMALGGPAGAAIGGGLGYMAGDSISKLIDAIGRLKDSFDAASAPEKGMSAQTYSIGDTGYYKPTDLNQVLSNQITSIRDSMATNERQTSVVEGSIRETALLKGNIEIMSTNLVNLGNTLTALKSTNLTLIDSLSGLTNLSDTLSGAGMWNAKDDSAFDFKTGTDISIPGYTRGKGITHIPSGSFDTTKGETASYKDMINLSMEHATKGQAAVMAAELKKALEDGVINYEEMKRVYSEALKPVEKNTKPKTQPVNKTGC